MKAEMVTSVWSKQVAFRNVSLQKLLCYPIASGPSRSLEPVGTITYLLPSKRIKAIGSLTKKGFKCIRSFSITTAQHTCHENYFIVRSGVRGRKIPVRDVSVSLHATEILPTFCITEDPTFSPSCHECNIFSGERFVKKPFRFEVKVGTCQGRESLLVSSG